MQKKIYPMSWVPNKAGTMVNVAINDGFVECEVKQGSDGCHYLYDVKSDVPLTSMVKWSDLKGFMYKN
jgi:hypothetical protein